MSACQAHDWKDRKVGTFDVLSHPPCTCATKDRSVPGKRRRKDRKAKK